VPHWGAQSTLALHVLYHRIGYERCHAILPPRLGQSRNPETPFTVVPFVDLPGVSADPMLFVNHLMAYNHDVSQEVDQTFLTLPDCRY